MENFTSKTLILIDISFALNIWALDFRVLKQSFGTKHIRPIYLIYLKIKLFYSRPNDGTFKWTKKWHSIISRYIHNKLQNYINKMKYHLETKQSKQEEEEEERKKEISSNDIASSWGVILKLIMLEYSAFHIYTFFLMTLYWISI